MEKDFSKNQRVAILVDDSNIFIACLQHNAKMNYAKVLDRLNHRQIVRSIFYHVEPNPTSQVNFIKRMQSMGYEVKTKQLKVYYDGKKKADMDVDIAIDAVCLADKVDVICILSGDGDYVPLVHYLKSRGIKVEAMAFETCTSRSLREAVDEFYPITRDMLIPY
jgi:uncharacterized LabA/DUF88 family protein